MCLTTQKGHLVILLTPGSNEVNNSIYFLNTIILAFLLMCFKYKLSILVLAPQP